MNINYIPQSFKPVYEAHNGPNRSKYLMVLLKKLLYLEAKTGGRNCSTNTKTFLNNKIVFDLMKLNFTINRDGS